MNYGASPHGYGSKILLELMEKVHLRLQQRLFEGLEGSPQSSRFKNPEDPWSLNGVLPTFTSIFSFNP